MSKATAIIAFISNELSMLYFLYNIIQRKERKEKELKNQKMESAGELNFHFLESQKKEEFTI